MESVLSRAVYSSIIRPPPLGGEGIKGKRNGEENQGKGKGGKGEVKWKGKGPREGSKKEREGKIREEMVNVIELYTPLVLRLKSYIYISIAFLL